MGENRNGGERFSMHERGGGGVSNSGSFRLNSESSIVCIAL